MFAYTLQKNACQKHTYIHARGEPPRVEVLGAQGAIPTEVNPAP